MLNPKWLLFNPLKSHWALIFVLWLILTGINLNKAFHIDDTYHLEAAEHIGQNPTKPMSIWINWEDSPTVMHRGNNPPLFFYLIYIHQLLFGSGEISLHMLLSIFTFLALFYFFQLSQLLQVKSPGIILTIFAFCPAFIVNQNIMLDIPILALSLSIMYYLLKGQQLNNTNYYAISATLLSVGMLIKYSLSPLFLVILVTILISKNYKKSIVLIIPIIVFIIWSIWNYMDFGNIHLISIISKPKVESQVNKLLLYGSKIVGFIGTLGAITTFTAIFIYARIPKKETRFLIIFGFIAMIINIPLVYLNVIEEVIFNRFLNLIFILNGFVLIGLIFYQSLTEFISKKYAFFRTPHFVILTYLITVAGFFLVLAPFNATRHCLLLIPFILLLGHQHFEATKGLINNLVVTGSIILGLLLGISDWVYADFYRKNASKIHYPNKRIWSIGHWGWQWYSRQAGMITFAKNNESNVHDGDLIVSPHNLDRQRISKEIQLEPIRFVTESPTFFTFFSGKDFGSMYSSSYKKPAWSLSNKPIDTLFVFKVKKYN